MNLISFESLFYRGREYTGPVVPAATDARLLRFGAFELHDELRRGGVLIKMTPQQLRVLRYLAEHTGEVVTREEIQREIWGSEVFVDFDRSLNVCIAQIRAALNDDSEAARFIQTIPRRGYRFVAPVELVTEIVEAPAAPPPRRRNLLWVGIAAAVLIASAVWWSSRTVPPPRIVLAVLPFENVTGRSQDTPAIDGLADELNSQFGTVLPERLGVIGRTSVRRFAGQRAGVAQIGRELAAAYVMEGDLRNEGPRVRISARLVKVADQAQVWSETYEMENASPLEMEEETAARITAGVIAALFPAARSHPATHVPSRDAYEAFVTGRYLQQKRTRADLQRALAFFEDAGRRDAAFAEPWAAMAEAYISLALSGAPDPTTLLEQARQSATRALALNEANAQAQNALGTVLLWRDWNAAEAERRLTRAITLNPSLATARHDYALLLILTGHPEAGVAELRRAIAIDPLSPRVNVDAGWLLLQAHRYDQAIAQAKRALELEPGLDEARACIARAEFHRGGATPAVRQFYQARLASPNPYDRALAQAVTGHPAEAVSALQEAYRQHSILMVMVGTEPAFSGLAGNPAYREIARQVWAGGDPARAR